MADNAAILQELKALREELAEAKDRGQRDQSVMSYHNGAAASATGAPETKDESAFEDMKSAIHQLIDAIEHSLAEHPATTHLTALAVGILLGRLSAR